MLIEHITFDTDQRIKIMLILMTTVTYTRDYGARK